MLNDVGKVLHLTKWKEVKTMKTLEQYQALEKKSRERAERIRIKNSLYVLKAKLAKIEVSEKEIDDYINTHK